MRWLAVAVCGPWAPGRLLFAAASHFCSFTWRRCYSTHLFLRFSTGSVRGRCCRRTTGWSGAIGRRCIVRECVIVCAHRALWAGAAQGLFIILLFGVDFTVDKISKLDKVELSKIMASEGDVILEEDITPFMRMVNSMLLLLELDFIYIQLTVWRVRGCTAQPSGPPTNDIDPNVPCTDDLLNLSSPVVWTMMLYFGLMIALTLNPWMKHRRVKVVMAGLYKRFRKDTKQWGVVQLLRSVLYLFGNIALRKFVGTVGMIPVFQGGFNIFTMMVFGVLQVSEHGCCAARRCCVNRVSCSCACILTRTRGTTRSSSCVTQLIWSSRLLASCTR